MGGTGSLRTLRISGANGSKTLGSLIANGSSSGAGSTMRMYKYYTSLGYSTQSFYFDVLGLSFGEFKGRRQLFTR
jgi:hypothetical protein